MATTPVVKKTDTKVKEGEDTAKLPGNDQPTQGKVVEKEQSFTRSQVEEEIKEAIANNVKERTSNSALTKEDLADILKTVLPATIMAMEQAKTQSVHEMTLKQIKQKLALEEKCHICRQVVGDGKGRGCGGPWARDKEGNFLTQEDGKTRIENVEQFHTAMAVYPNDPVAHDQWDGLVLNGIHYNSSGTSHKIWVPKKNDFAAIILKFEDDQRIQKIGRKRIGKNAGSVGPQGANVVPQTFT